MIVVRAGQDRGRTRISWLDSQHSFSFGDYFDPGNMGFRSLRVLNEDRVAPGAGFPTHGHRDMEILSYVLEGGLEHKDSSGGGGVIRPGEIQFMRAGRGVAHSEFNASRTDPVHFLQIWIVPDEHGLPPAYGQRVFDADRAGEGLRPSRVERRPRRQHPAPPGRGPLRRASHAGRDARLLPADRPACLAAGGARQDASRMDRL